MSHSTKLVRGLRLAVALSIGGSLAFAQSLTVTPSNNPSVTVGGTQQFTAVANGFTIAALKWEVANVQGGSAATGTIATGLTGGLYTAPAALPAQDPQSILAVATDTNGNKYSAMVYVTIAAAPPTITAVTPNPLAVGTINVTVTGTGLQTGAAVFLSYGNNIGIAMSPTGITAGSVSATGYLGAGASASFCVKNPGTGCSNSIVVPVGGAAPATYSLIVVNGTGNGTSSGSYTAGTVVNLVANAAPSGQQFQSWSGAAVTNSSSASTKLTMPAANTTVTANYSATSATTYSLTVVNGTGNGTSSGSYAAGTVVTITANAAPSGQQFQSWSGATVASANSATTTLTMPSANATVTANYSAVPAGMTITAVSPNPLPTGTVTVTITGTGFTASSTIWAGGVQYSTQQAGNTLTASIYIAPGTASATFTVNTSGKVSNAVTVPVSGPPTYTLTVVNGTINGTGSGPYTAATVVSISANPAPAGETFAGWTGASVTNPNATPTTITMPAANTTVTANFATGPTYALTVVGGQGSGNYVAGAVATIIANNPPAGQSFVDWTGATVASANSSTTNITMPASAVTVTANFTQPMYTLTVVNGTLGNGASSGSYAASTVVPISAAAAPAGEYFQSWTGPAVANANQPSTMVTMPQANATVTASFYTPTPIPFPVTTHPRLWITQQDLAHLQNWATTNNVTYQGLTGALGRAIGAYNSAFPGAVLNATNPVPANPYPDYGDSQGYTGMLTEENAVILAFNSLIDPNPTSRANYAQAARNLLMYAMNQAAMGPGTAGPFRDPSFPIYNRASFAGHEWPLIVDWIYPTLSASDKATIQFVFMAWANECLTAETTGGDNPGAPGLENSLALLTFSNKADVPYRMASNNYYLAHARLLTMMSLALDPSDDPPVNAALPPSALGNTLRSYIADATGAWLYEEFAMMGDPQAIGQDYNIPNNPTGTGFGLASGGLPPEGMLYGESFGYILGQLLALQTAGFNNPALSGPQIGMIGAPVWDRYMQGYLSSLTPAPQVPASETYLGSVYQYAAYGDMLRLWVSPDQMAPWALLALLDEETGTSTHVNAGKWFALNAGPNGAGGLLERMGTTPTWGVTQDLLYFMLLDPAAPAPTDPRPTFPTMFYDAPASRIVAHSDWTPNGTLFDYKAGWISINHQDGNGGQFELFRKGEWLTKEMSNYDSGGNGNGATVTYHNTLGLQNWCAICAGITWQGADAPAWANGGQWMENENAGDPATAMSTGAGYVYATSNLANLYNRRNGGPIGPDTVADIQQATRSIFWLNNDYIVVYDRATSGHNGFKRFNLSLTTQPTVSGNTATETLASGQQLFVQTLLPLNASLTSFYGPANMSPGALADLEPSQYIYQVQDPSNPLDTRFLHVLQGADPGAAEVPATYVQSSAGTAFDGAAFGSSAIYFPVISGGAFLTATLPAPAGVHTMLIAGLTPNASYGFAAQPGGGGNVVVVTANGTGVTADAAGVVRLTF